MARGWESKSVEAQIESTSETPSQHKPALTAEQAARLRRKTGLLLSRKHVLRQLETVHSVRHRQILEQALADLDNQLANLDESQAESTGDGTAAAAPLRQSDR